MEKKKLNLTLSLSSLHGVASSAGSFRDPLFSFVTPPKDGKIDMVTDLTYCRESLCEFIRQDLRSITSRKIDMKKLHMLIYRKVPPKDLKTKLKIFQDQVIAGQRMANAIEREYGWPLTKIYPADPGTDNVASNSKFYYIAASKRWIKSPVMLSLFTLLFRMSTNNQRFQFKNRITSMKSLFKVLDEIAPKISYGEMSYYRTHGKRWRLVLNNYQKLFGSRSMVSLYYPSAGGSYFFSEGINQICDENSKDKELNSAFCDIVKKHNEKTKGEML